MKTRNRERKTKQDAKHEGDKATPSYRIEMNKMAFGIPLGLIVGGLLLYFSLTMPRLKILGLLLVLLGLLAILALAIPLIRLYGSMSSLAKEERKMKMERLKEKVEEKNSEKNSEGEGKTT